MPTTEVSAPFTGRSATLRVSHQTLLHNGVVVLAGTEVIGKSGPDEADISASARSLTTSAAGMTAKTATKVHPTSVAMSAPKARSGMILLPMLLKKATAVVRLVAEMDVAPS